MRGTFRSSLALLGLITVVSASAPARADGFALNRFDPSPAGQPTFLSDHPWYAPAHWFAAGLTFSYAHNPLQLTDPTGTTAIVQHQLVGSIDAAAGLTDRINVSLSLPVTLYEGGTPADGVTALDGIAAGDLRLGATVRLWGNANRDPLSVHLAGALWLPTGNRSDHQGDGDPRGALRAILAGRFAQRFRYTFDTGVSLRAKQTFSDMVAAPPAGTELLFGGEVAFLTLDERLSIGPEVAGSTLLIQGRAFESTATALEILPVSAHCLIANQVMVGVAAGFDAGDAIGTPDARVLLRIAYAPPRR